MRYPPSAMIQTSLNSVSSWRSILPPESAGRALRVVEEIAADLRSRLAASSREMSPSLAGGTAGLALFFSYLAQARPGEASEHLATALPAPAATHPAQR